MAGITNIEELNTVIGLCGCCPAPRCCPPLIQCQSGHSEVAKAGFINNDDLVDIGSDSNSEDGPWAEPVRYLRKVRQVSEENYEEIVSYPYPSEETYVRETIVTNGVERRIEEISAGFDASISGVYNVAACYQERASVVNRCEFSGTRVVSSFGINWESGAWFRFKSLEVSTEYSSAEGEETDAHKDWEVEAADWDLENPDYESEHESWESAHSAWVTAHADWVVAYDAWLESDQTTDPPVEPEEPIEPPPRPIEPEEFYDSCAAKLIMTATLWERVLDGSVWSTRLVDPAETPSGENPHTETSYYVGTGSPLNGPSRLDILYEEPVTHAEFLALADQWVRDNAHRVIKDDDDSSLIDSSSSNPGCESGTLCRARRVIGGGINTSFDSFVQDDFFRFRIKLNKCCGYKTILSKWLQVFYPQEWLDWESRVLAGDSEAGPEPAIIPTGTVRGWSWTGIPPLCEESSESSSSSSVDPLDPFDHKPMWSPFSLLIFLPVGEVGEILNRNYAQQCYPSGELWDEMPEVFGELDLESSSSAAE